MTNGSNRIKAAMFVVFFVTGMCGLVYEVVASRLLRLVMGNTVFAITAVLCAFMGGLALGSILGGRLAERRKDLLRVFAILQFAVAAYFFFLPWLISGVAPLYRAIHGGMGVSFRLVSLVRFFFCGLLLLLPCTLMGATLPILSRTFAQSPEEVSGFTGTLYAVNTLGGALGAWGAGFVLVPVLGVRASLWVACAMSALAGVAVWTMRGTRAPAVKPHDASGAERIAPDVSRSAQQDALKRTLLIGYGLAGAAGLTYEIAWIRVLTLLIGSSVYAFSLMLTAFILGLGLGSMIMARFAGRFGKPLAVLGIIEFAVGYAAMGVLPFFDRLPFIVTQLLSEYGGSFRSLQAIEFGLILVIMLVPTLLMGAAFPLVARLFAEQDGTTGRSIGLVCGINTLGCIVGAFLAGFWLIPALGIERTIVAAVLINAFAGCLFLGRCRRLSRLVRIVTSAAIVIVLLVIIVSVPRWDVSKMTFGPYVEARKLSKEAVKVVRALEARARQNKVLYHEEGVSSTVTVKESPRGERVIFVNGKPDASSSADLPTQVMIAQLPLLLHPKPTSAMVVGLASGISLGSASLHNLEVLDCIEISPEMLNACRYFEEDNYKVLRNPDVNVIIEDARNYLEVSSRKYDVIISEPSNPWVSGESDLFTREFFELCRDKLEDDGILCAWVESYTIDEKDFRSVVRTFQSVFPEMTIWSPMAWDFLMVGAKSKLAVDVDEFTGRMMRPAIAKDLSRIHVHSTVDLLGNLVMGEEGVQRLVGDVPIHTDDNALLEFSSPATVVRNEGRWALSRIMEKNREAAFSFITGKDEALAKRVRQEAGRRVWARGHVIQGALLLDEGRRAEAFAELKAASSLSPGDRELRKVLTRDLSWAARLVRAGDVPGALALYSEIVDLDPGNPDALYGLGFVLEKMGRLSEAMAAYKKALAGNPNHATYRAAVTALSYKLRSMGVEVEP